MGVGQSLLTSIIPGSSSSGSSSSSGTKTTAPVKQATGAVWTVVQGPNVPMPSTTSSTSSTSSASQASWLEQNKDLLLYGSVGILVVLALKK